MFKGKKKDSGSKPKDLHKQGGAVLIPGQPDLPSSRVELMLSAKNLKDKDVLTVSDPMCVVYLKTQNVDEEPHFAEVGRTEVISNNLHPEWNTKIQLDYLFETKQQLRFEIYDIDNNSGDLTAHDFLGRCECYLADIVTALDGALTLKLVDEPKQKGILIIRAEEIDIGQKEVVQMICHGRRIAPSGGICSFYFKTDPFLEFYRLYQNGTKQLICRTAVLNGTVNPEWEQIEITVRHLCEGDKDREFLVKCFDYRIGGRHKLLGHTLITVNKLVTQRKRDFELISDRGGKKSVETGGTLHFLQAECRPEYTWLDFVKGGMQLEFTVCVDFTASNGAVTELTSRHHIDPVHLNQYEIAIRSVLEICEFYNSTKTFEAFGFGAKIPPRMEVSHHFPLDVDSCNSTVIGVRGVMEAYRCALNRVELYGPTNFEPTVRHLLQKCQKFPRDGSRYQILLIITDGLISDMAKTIEAIIEASDQPLSIIIIGVGEEDFEKMDELDSDESMLAQGTRIAKRDIVQFVPFKECEQNPHFVTRLLLNQQIQVQTRLAKAVLEEVPYQVTSYMKMHKIEPLRKSTSNIAG